MQKLKGEDLERFLKEKFQIASQEGRCVKRKNELCFCEDCVEDEKLRQEVNRNLQLEDEKDIKKYKDNDQKLKEIQERKKDYQIRLLRQEYGIYEHKTYESNRLNNNPYPPYTCYCFHCKQTDFLKRDEIKGDFNLNPDSEKLQLESWEQVKYQGNDEEMKKKGDFLCFVQLLNPQEKGKAQRLPQIFILDTLFFQESDPALMVYNNSDEETGLFFQKNLEMMSFFQIRQIFNKRRNAYDQMVRQIEEMEAKKMKALESQMTSQRSAQVVMEEENSAFNKKMRDIKQNMLLGQADRQFAHIFYKTNEANQIISYSDFNFMMDRRRKDPFWEKVAYIQSCQIEKLRVYKVVYIYDREKEQSLFRRAKEDFLQMQTVQRYWESSWYKEEQVILSLLKRSNVSQYLMYLCFKLVIFGEQVNKVRVRKSELSFVKDKRENFYLVGCGQLYIQDVGGIENQDIFVFYLKNYSKQEQREILQGYYEKIEQEEKRLKEKREEFERQKKLNQKDKESEKYECMSELIHENGQYLIQNYVKKIDQMYLNLDRLEEKKITSEMFRNLHLNNHQSDFYDLITLQYDPKKLKHFLKKSHLLDNFPLDKKQFVTQVKFRYKQENKQEYLKKISIEQAKPRFDEIQQPITNQVRHQRQIYKSQTKINSLKKMPEFVDLKALQNNFFNQEGEERDLVEISKIKQIKIDNQKLNHQNRKIFYSKSQSQMEICKNSPTFSEILNSQKITSYKGTSAFRSIDEQTKASRNSSQHSNLLSNKLSSPFSHLIQSQYAKSIMSENSPILEQFKNSQFSNKNLHNQTTKNSTQQFMSLNNLLI